MVGLHGGSAWWVNMVGEHGGSTWWVNMVGQHGGSTNGDIQMLPVLLTWNIHTCYTT